MKKKSKPTAYINIVFSRARYERLSARMLSAGLDPGVSGKKGTRGTAIDALLDLADIYPVAFANICKARAMATVYSKPSAPQSKRARLSGAGTSGRKVSRRINHGG